MPLSQLTADRIEALTAVFEKLFGGQPQSFALLTGGYSSSSNYRFDMHSKAYALRVMGFDQPIADREQQIRCMQIASTAGITPKVHYADPQHGFVIMDFVSQKPLKESTDWPETVAELLKKLHSLNGAFEPPYQSLFVYMQDLQKRLHSFSLSPILLDYLKNIEITQRLLSKHHTQTSCHNDLNTNNVLFDGNHVYFIDWEAAGLEDPYFDLAMVCTQMMDESPEACLTEQDRFLNCYFGKTPTIYQKAKLMLMKQIAFCWPAIHFLEFAGNAGLDLSQDATITQGPSLRTWGAGYISGKHPLQSPTDFLLYAGALVQESTKQINSAEFHNARALLNSTAV